MTDLSFPKNISAHSDGAGFERLTARGDIMLAACWAHARWKFFDLHEATRSKGELSLLNQT